METDRTTDNGEEKVAKNAAESTESSSKPGGQIYCTHPTHGPTGYLGTCYPDPNNPYILKEWNAHVAAYPAHSGYIQAQPCTA
jgi:hypothetical protein